MDYYQIDQIRIESNRKESSFLEFLRQETMSAGIYTLPAGSQDPQEAHNEDELYYVLGGSAVIEVSGQQKPVSPGSAVFVPAHVDHKFLNIEEDLAVLVIFSPVEDSSS